MNLAEATALLRRWSPRRTSHRPLGSAAWQLGVGAQLESLFDWLVKRPQFSAVHASLPHSAAALPAASRPHAAVVMACADICGASPDAAIQVALLSSLLHASLLTDDAPTAAAATPFDDDRFEPAPWRARLAQTLLGVIESHNPGDAALQDVRGRLRLDHHATVLQPALQAWVWQSTTPLARFRLDDVVDRSACIGIACADMVLHCGGRVDDPGLGVALRVFAGRLGSVLIVSQLHELRRVRALRQPALTAVWQAEHRAFAIACQRAVSVHADAAMRSVGALPIGADGRAALRAMGDRLRGEALAALRVNDAALMPFAAGPRVAGQRRDIVSTHPVTHPVTRSGLHPGEPTPRGRA